MNFTFKELFICKYIRSSLAEGKEQDTSAGSQGRMGHEGLNMTESAWVALGQKVPGIEAWSNYCCAKPTAPLACPKYSLLNRESRHYKILCSTKRLYFPEDWINDSKRWRQTAPRPSLTVLSSHGFPKAARSGLMLQGYWAQTHQGLHLPKELQFKMSGHKAFISL